MTGRERTYNILHFKKADRMPAVHFGYWPELLEEWVAQGHLRREDVDGWYDGGPKDEALNRILGWDFDWQHMFSGNNGLLPPFETKVVETFKDGSRAVQNGNGIIERIQPGVTSIPAEYDYLLKDREAFETLFAPKMAVDIEKRVNFDWFRRFNEDVYDKTDVPLGLHLGSVMGSVRDMTSVIGMSYLMYDEDETLFKDVVDTWANMQYEVAKAVLETGAKFDFAHFWEDICFNGGPLLSPALFEELCADHYKKRTDLCREHGIDIVSLDCDGVVEKLLPVWVENGVNVMFPIEVGTWGDQFEKARKKYGEKVLGVGGMDKTVLRLDKAAVDREIEKMRRLTSLGGFIPCPDHRLMPGTKFELVQYYCEEIKKIEC